MQDLIPEIRLSSMKNRGEVRNHVKMLAQAEIENSSANWQKGLNKLLINNLKQ